ncbi:UNVERIFIED_CONTAM: hypothetical protein Sradi_0760700 [Sesamum radiatum]|uniref:Uncharacterized protein n=1 Tax=Sesamum radiatum TaxID=300843 RepID=A0AAW2VQ33_SESRA
MREICRGLGSRLWARQREFCSTRGMAEVGGKRRFDWMDTWPKTCRRIFRPAGGGTTELVVGGGGEAI